MSTTKNIGIWIRVSTEMQVKDESPEIHERRAKMYAEAKGWNVVTVYRLDALSGKSVLDYPETKRMLKDIEQGTISGIIFSKLARLARNTKELLEISELFREQNADLISLAESIDTSTPAGRLFFTIIAAMAQWEREEIADRVAKSVPIRASMGKSLGGAAIFGYEWKNGQYVVEPKEAPIRKLIYEIFLKTKRKQTTATEINKLGYRTRNGSLFSDNTIGRLIEDSSAKGIRIANHSKSTGEGKHWVRKPKEEWIEQPCEAIVSEELWNSCNEILAKNANKKRRTGKQTTHLLAGYLYCSCGKKMYIYHEAKVYKCSTCKKKIEANDIDEIYHEQLRSFLLTDADIESHQNSTQHQINEKEQLLRTVQIEYEKLYKKLEFNIDLRRTGELTKEDFAAFYEPVQIQLRQIEKQIPELQAEIDFYKIQSLSSGTIIEEAKDLHNSWKELPFDEKRNIIETITDKITIHADTIDIAFSYLPAPLNPFQNGVNSRQSFKDSSKQPT
jgi:site-specific DNA recombinase